MLVRCMMSSRITTVGPGTWYLPHHGIYHPQKSKVRVVFDCSATFEWHALNDKLLQGPDLTSNLVGVLTRFRQEIKVHQVSISADTC